MINNSISKAVFKGNDVATQFPFEFKIWDISQLYLEVSSGDDIVAEVTNFSAVLNDSGGVVTYLHEGAPLPTGWTLAILRNMPFTQHVDLINGTRFNPEVIEDALDKATAERQELREGISRAVQVDASSDVRPEELIQELRENTTLAVNSAESSAHSAMDAQESANDAAASASAAQKSADDAAKSAAEAGEAAGEAAVARVEAEGDTQVARVQTEGDTVLSSMAELASAAFIPGMVVAFTGSFGGPDNAYPIPNGSTEPDMTWKLHEPSRGKFILGGTGQNQGVAGGSTTTQGHTLTNTQVGSAAVVWAGVEHTLTGGPSLIFTGNQIVAASSHQAHSHEQNLPPYYTLAYIEKLPTSGGGGGSIFVSQETFNNAVAALENGKQDTLEAGDNITIVNNVISATGGGGGGGGENGATFTPTITQLSSNSIEISWTNDGGLPNPDPVTVTAPKGADGTDGVNGTNGKDGTNGTNGTNGEDGLTTSVSINSTTFTQTGGNIGLPVIDMIVTLEDGSTLTYKVVAVNG